MAYQLQFTKLNEAELAWIAADRGLVAAQHRSRLTSARAWTPRRCPWSAESATRWEVSRAYSLWNRLDDALTTLLDAERLAPEQVRYHYLGRQLTLTWLRRSRGKPSPALLALARRLQVQP